MDKEYWKKFVVSKDASNLDRVREISSRANFSVDELIKMQVVLNERADKLEKLGETNKLIGKILRTVSLEIHKNILNGDRLNLSGLDRLNADAFFQHETDTASYIVEKSQKVVMATGDILTSGEDAIDKGGKFFDIVGSRLFFEGVKAASVVLGVELKSKTKF